MADTVDWPGASRKTYPYWFASEMQNPCMKQEGGNYMFVTQRTDGWHPLYIGQTKNLDNRLTNHPELACVCRNNGTHLMAHTTPAGESAPVSPKKQI